MNDQPELGDTVMFNPNRRGCPTCVDGKIVRIQTNRRGLVLTVRPVDYDGRVWQLQWPRLPMRILKPGA